MWEMIRKGMMKKIGEAPAPVQTIFDLAVKGKQTLPWPLSSMIDKVLFARVKQAVGGRLRLAVCGGGQLSATTQLFLSTVLAPMMQGEACYTQPSIPDCRLRSHRDGGNDHNHHAGVLVPRQCGRAGAIDRAQACR